MLAIRLPVELEKRLNKLAKSTGRTKTFYAREAIRDQIDDLEDAYMSEKVLRRIENGTEQVFSIDEIIEEASKGGR